MTPAWSSSWSVRRPEYREWAHHRPRHRTYRRRHRRPGLGSECRFDPARRCSASRRPRCDLPRHEALARHGLWVQAPAERAGLRAEVVEPQIGRRASAQFRQRARGPVVQPHPLRLPGGSCRNERKSACAVGCPRDSGRNAPSLGRSPLPGACHTADRKDCQIGSLSHSWGSPSAGI